MVYIAEIVSIDTADKSCMVNLPDCKGVADAEQVIRKAQFAEAPGVIQGYQVGDAVWVGFILGDKAAPVVLGRIPKTTNTYKGSLTGSDLKITDSAVIPLNTTITGTTSGFNNLTQILNQLKKVTNFVESYEGLDYKLANAENNNPGGNTPIDPEVINQAIEQASEKALWHSVTAVYTKSEILSEVDNNATIEFPLGKIIYVRNDSGKNYTFQSELEIYPVFSLCTDYLTAEDPVVEFSNVPQDFTNIKIKGFWRVKDILSGGVLAQRCESNVTPINKVIILSNGETCHLTDSFGNAQSHYWELNEQGGISNAILTRDLVFLNSKGVPISELTGSSEDNVTIHGIAKRNPSYDPSDPAAKPYIYLQRYDGDQKGSDIDDPPDGNNDDTLDNISVLYLTEPLVNKGGYLCRFKTYTNQTTIFKHSKNSLSPEAGTEAVFLPESYNMTYKDNYSAISEYLFHGASRLTTIYIPTTTGIIKKGAFSGVGKERALVQKYVQLLNFENSSVHNIKAEAFQNIAFENQWLKLPRLPIGGRIYFGQGVFSYYNYDWTLRNVKLKTLFVNSLLDFDHEYIESTNATTVDRIGDMHKGAFFNGSDHVNNFVWQLVYSTDKTWTYELLKNSSIISFLRTEKALGNLSVYHEDEEPIIGDAVDAVLAQFKESTASDFIAEVEVHNTLSEVPALLKVRFIDSSKVKYNLNDPNNIPTIPTIIYNYNV